MTGVEEGLGREEGPGEGRHCSTDFCIMLQCVGQRYSQSRSTATSITMLALPRPVVLCDHSYYYVKSYAEGSGIVRLPAGIV